MTYKLDYGVWHWHLGRVVLPDQVVAHMSFWDEADMPVPAILEDGRVVEISLEDTDA